MVNEIERPYFSILHDDSGFTDFSFDAKNFGSDPFILQLLEAAKVGGDLMGFLGFVDVDPPAAVDEDWWALKTLDIDPTDGNHFNGFLSGVYSFAFDMSITSPTLAKLRIMFGYAVGEPVPGIPSDTSGLVFEITDTGGGGGEGAVTITKGKFSLAVDATPSTGDTVGTVRGYIDTWAGANLPTLATIDQGNDAVVWGDLGVSYPRQDNLDTGIEKTGQNAGAKLRFRLNGVNQDFL